MSRLGTVKVDAPRFPLIIRHCDERCAAYHADWADDALADGACCDNAQLALGKNVLVSFMPWNGYNYEDAILISERMVKDDVYTSIHIERHESEAVDTKLGPEEITRDSPNVGEDAL